MNAALTKKILGREMHWDERTHLWRVSFGRIECAMWRQIAIGDYCVQVNYLEMFSRRNLPTESAATSAIEQILGEILQELSEQISS